MRKSARSQRGRVRAETLRVELLEERKLLNGRNDFAGPGFIADAEWPDKETQSAENGSAAEVDDGEGYEVERDDGSVSSADDLPRYHEAEDDSGEKEDEAFSWTPPATEGDFAIQSFEDEREQSPTSQGGNTKSTPPSATTPVAGGQSQSAEIDDADEAFEATDDVTQSTDESPAASEARSPVARQSGIPNGASADMHAEAARVSVATRSDESTPSEPAANRDSAAPPVSTPSETADTDASKQSVPVIHAMDKVAGQPRQKETPDLSEKVDTGTAAVEPAPLKSLVAYSAPLISMQLPLVAIVDAVLATPPQVAGLLTDFISIDMTSIEREIDTLLGQIDGLRRELAGSLAEMNLPTWFLAAAVGAGAAEVVRLQRKRVPGALAAVVRNGDSSTWLPDSAGPTPEELT